MVKKSQGREPKVCSKYGKMDHPGVSAASFEHQAGDKSRLWDWGKSGG